MFHIRLFPAFLLAASVAVTADGAKPKASGSAQTVRHSFFVAGPTLTGIVGEDGQVVWDAKKRGGRDGFVLPSGNILICWSDVVKEFDAKTKKVVFEFKRRQGVKELGTVERLKNGRTLVTELGPAPKLLEVDSSGKVTVEVPLQPETNNAHMQTRMARKLAGGNYLVPHLLAFAVKEYTPEGKVVRTHQTDLEELGGRKAENWPFTAIRLPNGNSLYALTHGNKIVEMDPSGKVVWKASNKDFPGIKNLFADPCGAQRLPNGNTVIASYGARGKNRIKMFEITRDKKLIWSQKKYKAHHFQILATDGKPIEGPPLK
ncbi:MAG: PQQ-binding-like beta-propeller repeat protein [Phycisphaeraceae bacterium]|nr:PQQ-binding-like beta-propeller repeat protein [Phycisphaeraceae bacterium]